MSYASTLADLGAYVRVQVAVGHADLDAIVEETASMFQVDEQAVRPLAEAACAAALADVPAWPAVTDCDRLDAAFAALDRAGIRARQHFTCCNSCGHYEMTEDIHRDRRFREAQIDGYVFYHRQDAEIAVIDGVLNLRHATIGDDDARALAVARHVETALRDVGLAPVWDGNLDRTIQLHGFRWQRRAWPREGVAPPPDMLAVWCRAFERTAPSEFVASLREPFLHALPCAVALAFAHAVPAAGLVPRAKILGSLARRHGDRALWLEALACCIPYRWTIVELLFDLDLADPVIREAARLRISEMHRDALHGAAMAWFAARIGAADDHLLPLLHRHLDSDEDAPSAKLAIRAALWALGDDAMRAPVVEAATTDLRFGFDDYAIAAAARAAQLRGCTDDHAAIVGPPRPATSVDAAIAEVAKRTEGYDEGLYTEDELEAARYELAILQGDLANLAARYRDEQRAGRSELRRHLEAVRDGALPRIVAVDPIWLDGSRDRTIARHVATWQAATTREARRRERHAGRRVLLAATSIASIDRDRAIALVDAILDGNDSDVVDADSAIQALLAIDRLDAAVQVADERLPSSDGFGPLITALARAGRRDDARDRLGMLTSHLFSQHDVAALAPAVAAVADDPRAAATTMLEASARAEAAIDALLDRLTTA